MSACLGPMRDDTLAGGSSQLLLEPVRQTESFALLSYAHKMMKPLSLLEFCSVLAAMVIAALPVRVGASPSTLQDLAATTVDVQRGSHVDADTSAVFLIAAETAACRTGAFNCTDGGVIERCLDGKWAPTKNRCNGSAATAAPPQKQAAPAGTTSSPSVPGGAARPVAQPTASPWLNGVLSGSQSGPCADAAHACTERCGGGNPGSSGAALTLASCKQACDKGRQQCALDAAGDSSAGSNGVR